MTISGSPAWDSFWHYDRLSSFLSAPGAGNYGPEISAGWRAFFAALPLGALVVDIATGNGAIAVMAVAAGKGFAVTGTDLADIDPATFVSTNAAELGQVNFLSRVPAEELPFKAESVDAIVSQYGIDYSDLARSIPEAVRVLAPGGRLRLAMHAAEGAVARDTRSAIADADFLINLGLADLATRSGSGAQGLATFNATLKSIAERAPTATDKPMLANVHRTLCNSYDHRPAELRSTADHLEGEIRAHRERQSALLASAQSLEEMHQLGARLSDLGMTGITHDEQRDGTDLIGHVIEARRE